MSARRVRGTEDDDQRARWHDHPQTRSPSRTAAPRPTAGSDTVGAWRGAWHTCCPGRRSASVRPRRPRRHGMAAQQRRRTGHRVMAGGRHRSGLRPFRAALRRSEHRSRVDGEPADVGYRRCPQDQGGRGVSRREPSHRIGARRRRRADGEADDDHRARRHRRSGRQGQTRGTPRRADRPQGNPGRRGRGAGGQLLAVEGRR